MNIFHYDPVLLLFVGVGVADPDPMTEGDWLMPAHATSLVPPITTDGRLTRFNPAIVSWELIDAPAPVEPLPPVKVPPLTLDQHQQEAIKELDAHADRLYAAGVVSGGMAAEYAAAYEWAKEWLVYPERTAPARITALAEVYDMSEAQAAEMVCQKYESAQRVFDLRGAARLRAKSAIRSAMTLDDVAQALVAGIASIDTALDAGGAP